MIDLTKIILALMSFAFTLITTFAIPYCIQLYKNSKIKNVINKTQAEIAKNELAAKAMDELRKAIIDAVKGASERLWQEKGTEKRKDAISYVKQVLETQGLTFSEEIINKTMDAMVQERRDSGGM